MKLTAATVNATLKAGRHSDGRNLYLSVSPTGGKSWLFIWRAENGKQRELGLGSFTGAGSTTALSLKEARLAADMARMQIAAGIDPIEAKVAAKRTTVTFASLMADAITAFKGNAKDGWKVVNGVCEQEAEWTRSLTTHAASLMTKQAGRIGDAEVVAVLKPIWFTIPVTAERVRYRIEKIMAVAISRKVCSGENPARYEGHIENLVGKRPTKKGQDNHAALHYDAAPALVAKLLASKGTAAKGLAFTILTATRTDEARLARWSEVDLDKGLWTIPAERMKAGVEHIVPLSTTAIDLLVSLGRTVGNDFVFTGQKEGSAVGATAFSDKLTDPVKKGGLGLKGQATVHGMRSTFSDWVGDETSFAKEDREFCLAHGLDAVEGAYRRASAVKKRRAIMQAWANYCEGKGNVVALQVAA